MVTMRAPTPTQHKAGEVLSRLSKAKPSPVLQKCYMIDRIARTGRPIETIDFLMIQVALIEEMRRMLARANAPFFNQRVEKEGLHLIVKAGPHEAIAEFEYQIRSIVSSR